MASRYYGIIHRDLEEAEEELERVKVRFRRYYSETIEKK